MHSFPEDVFVFVLVDVFALIVRFDGKLHLLHRSLLSVQLLQVLRRSEKRHTELIMRRKTSVPVQCFYKHRMG